MISKIPAGVLPNVAAICAEVVAANPQVTHVWGHNTVPDHDNRRCVDYMVYNSGLPADQNLPKSAQVALGDAIAAYNWKHRDRLGLVWQIWNGRAQRTYAKTLGGRSYRPGEWAPYDGPNPHTDHVHAEYTEKAHVAPSAWDGKSYPGREAFVLGRRHPAVTLLGRRLVAHGWSGYQSGPGPQFTETDRNAVEWFQRQQGWTGNDADGYPGRITWQRLMAKPRPRPDVEPGTVEVVLTLNTHRSTDPGDRPPWSRRKAQCIAAIKSTKASVICVQECTPAQRADITAATGIRFYAKGNVGVGHLPRAWTVEHDNYYDLETGNDDRWLVAVVLKHKKTGRKLKIGSTHLTNHEGGGSSADGWRLGQAQDINRSVPDLNILGGDFNDSGPVYAEFAKSGLLQLRKKTPEFEGYDLRTVHHYGAARKGGAIDDNLTDESVNVRRAWLVRTDRDGRFPKATDHHGVAAEIEL